MYPKVKNYYYNFLYIIEADSQQYSKKMESIQTELNKTKKYIDNYYKNQSDTEIFNKLINLIDPFKTYKYALESMYNIQLASSTWLCIWEILKEFHLIPSKYDDQTYLCFFNDSYGSCISSVNHYIKTMTSIKSFVWYACGNENNFQKSYTSRWISNAQMNLSNIQTITSRLTEKINLFISDISANSADYTMQEISHLQNNIGQTLLGLKLLNSGGSMILKMYTLFNEVTRILLYLLRQCFESVIIYKPLCNKGINGDIFIICQNYTPNEKIVEIIYNYLQTGDFKLLYKDETYSIPVLPMENYYKIQNNIFIDLIGLVDRVLSECGGKTFEEFNTLFKILKNKYKKEHLDITSNWIKRYPINFLKYKDKLQIK